MKQEFDQYIDDYRRHCDQALRLSGETSAYFAEYKAKKLSDWLKRKIPAKAQILDFGCGDGLMTQFVHNEFPNGQIYGVDPSPKSIEAAQKQCPGVMFSVNSEESMQLDFENHSLDLVFSAGVFHHIPFAHHDKYMAELARIVKPGGYIVLFELNPLNPFTVWTFKHTPIDRHAHMLRPQYTYRLMKQYGSTEVLFYCFYPKMFSWLRKTEPLLTKVPFGALYASLTQKRGR
ncbi:MAG: methyltransferase domain-containing protein [Verrucomicrobia bacterium]|nr:methyltransferase domain-containing protein [Verrucomicrobiota bacterium]MBU6445924.1 methyltransferase domain-containing protein [Verrucomicrobiota bacterium]MDE3047520.1 class I SAM-dependent methyltransferase [Verrucomicrobiota bacterium]